MFGQTTRQATYFLVLLGLDLPILGHSFGAVDGAKACTDEEHTAAVVTASDDGLSHRAATTKASARHSREGGELKLHCVTSCNLLFER